MDQNLRRRYVTAALMVATFLAAIEGTIISTAMPTIVSDLGGLQLISWVYSVYLLTSAVSTPIYGKLADLFGRKGVFVAGTLIFLAGSALSGLAQSMHQLIAFRAFQGIGAGAILTLTFTILGDIYTMEGRARIQGLFSAIWGISGILGPLAGGFLVDQVSWRWIFYINVPFGLIAIIMIWIYLRESFDRKKKHIDYWGALTFVISMSTLLFALNSGGQTYAWNSSLILALFAVSILAFASFIWIQLKSPEPMLPLKLFTLRAILVSNLAGFFVSAILIGITAYLPIWIQGIFGSDATSSGLTLTPMSIGWPIASFLSGRFMLKLGTKSTSLFGGIILLAGSAWLAAVSSTTPHWIFTIIMLISGFGFGLTMTAFTVVVQSAVDWQLRGAATASNNFVRTLGQTVGIAIFGTLFNNRLTAYFAAHPVDSSKVSGKDISQLYNPEVLKKLPSQLVNLMRDALSSSLHTIFLFLFIIALVSAVTLFWLPQLRSREAASKRSAPATE